MTFGLCPESPKGWLPIWCRVVLVAALVAAGCSDDGDEGSSDAPPVATVHDVEIFEADVEALASDAGFRAFIGAPEPGDDEEDIPRRADAR